MTSYFYHCLWRGPDILTVCLVVYVASNQIFFLAVSVAVSAANGQLFSTVCVVVYVASDWIFL